MLYKEPTMTDAKTLQNKARQSATSKAMWKREGHKENHSEKLTGRARPDQSTRMSGDNNIMAGKESPNRGKEMPQISEKIKGKAKPEGFGDKVSKAKKGVPIPSRQGVERPEHSKLMKMKNPMFRPIRTPYGDFDSIRFVIFDEKARGMKNVERRVRKLLNTPDSGYYYIDNASK
jgi:hypothetical protein